MKQKVTQIDNLTTGEFDHWGSSQHTQEMKLSKLIELYGHLPDATIFVNDLNDHYYRDEYDASNVVLAVSYLRDETDDEYEKRLIKEEKNRIKQEKEKIRREAAKQKRLIQKDQEKEAALKEFERLKKTYGFK